MPETHITRNRKGRIGTRAIRVCQGRDVPACLVTCLDAIISMHHHAAVHSGQIPPDRAAECLPVREQEGACFECMNRHERIGWESL